MDDATNIDFTGRGAVTDPLTALLRKGARELLQAAVEAERDAFLAEFAGQPMAAQRLCAVDITQSARSKPGSGRLLSKCRKCVPRTENR